MEKINYNGPYTGDLNDGKVIYYKNNDEECLKNYVWYSGKLWRIVAIYPDGKMKLVTENNMTAIAWNAANNTNYENSYIDQWLTREFLPTLYDPDNKIIVPAMEAEWNIQMTTATTDPYDLVCTTCSQ